MARSKKEVIEEALEKKLCRTADKLRKNMDAAEYKHVVLGLVFLKYISDAFEELAQAKNYVVAYDFPLGLLINFGSQSLQYKLLFNSRYHPKPNSQNSIIQ